MKVSAVVGLFFLSFTLGCAPIEPNALVYPGCSPSAPVGISNNGSLLAVLVPLQVVIGAFLWKRRRTREAGGADR